MNQTGTSPTIAADWVAAGVRHEILMRVLPTLRHDLLGPISVARMELAVMRRRLERADLAQQDGLRRVRQLDGHLVDLTRGLRELRRWDPLDTERMPASAIVRLALMLMEQPLRLAGLEVSVETDCEAEDTELPLAPLLLGTLALLCHAQDQRASGQRLCLHLATRPEGEAAVLSVRTEPRPETGSVPPPMPALPDLPAPARACPRLPRCRGGASPGLIARPACGARRRTLAAARRPPCPRRPWVAMIRPHNRGSESSIAVQRPS
ncbi:hypothetical protein SAMN05421778_11031 [Sphaerotilus natans]|uniref:hypothetical protein n=2 Tax=Sphaerotilus natans TaxID=34103 RepID=UPI000954F4A1|nr:hypothetical protein [Sphaerotilus natans]SIR42139.1 hypothetical protein SAMN05421778_11031 [Sphaerotilus natans]